MERKDDNLVVEEEYKPISDETLLSIRDLHVWFELRKFGFGHAGYVRAVDGVSFDLRKKETIAIVGESGCGKTSLMKTILGINTPTKGELFFDGIPLSSLHSRELQKFRSQVGYVQQDPYGALAPFMNIKSIMEEPLIIHGVKDKDERLERIHRAFEEVKMTPVAEFLPKFPHMLSGGQQQRVVLARAIILNPRLLVADEPVSMLDASVRVEILRLLDKLQEAHNLSVIYITHDLSTVRYFSEYIFVMYAGEIIEKAYVEDLIFHPAHPYTWALLSATSDPDAKNVDEFQNVPPGEPPSLVKPPKGCRFHPRCSKMIPGLCDVERPPEFTIGEGHLTRCWLYAEGVEGESTP